MLFGRVGYDALFFILRWLVNGWSKQIKIIQEGITQGGVNLCPR